MFTDCPYCGFPVALDDDGLPLPRCPNCAQRLRGTASDAATGPAPVPVATAHASAQLHADMETSASIVPEQDTAAPEVGGDAAAAGTRREVDDPAAAPTAHHDADVATPSPAASASAPLATGTDASASTVDTQMGASPDAQVAADAHDHTHTALPAGDEAQHAADAAIDAVPDPAPAPHELPHALAGMDPAAAVAGDPTPAVPATAAPAHRSRADAVVDALLAPGHAKPDATGVAEPAAAAAPADVPASVAIAADPAAAEPSAAAAPLPVRDVPARTAAAPSFARGARRAVAVGRRRRLLDIGALLALLLLLGLQLLVADRARLAGDARWRPVVATLCNAVGCSLPAWREARAFHVVERDVRASSAGTLQVTARFRNDARWPQPWPAVQLTLADTHGRDIATRVFLPREYLGGAPTQSTLGSGQEASLSMEIVEPGPQAVAFTFDFH